MIGEMIADFAVAASRLRFVEGSLVAGVYHKQNPTSSACEIAAVPVTGDDLKRCPEGTRLRSVLKFYTQTEFRAAEDDPLRHDSDHVVYNSRRWEVVDVRDWSDQGDFFEVCAVLVAGAATQVSVYFGTGEVVADADDILALAEAVFVEATFTFIVDADGDDFIWFAWPDSKGDAVFTVDGFIGGFVRVSGTFTVDGVACRLFRSLYAGLGAVTVTVDEAT